MARPPDGAHLAAGTRIDVTHGLSMVFGDTPASYEAQRVTGVDAALRLTDRRKKEMKMFRNIVHESKH